MAKSIRSKFKRKMRALKREKLAPRVQKKLIATVSRLNDAKAGPSELLDPGKFISLIIHYDIVSLQIVLMYSCSDVLKSTFIFCDPLFIVD